MSKTLQSPISYYGGKKNMLQHILPLIPPHRIYTEPFFGGGAVFFAKKPMQSEIINDSNNMVINFYKVLRQNPEGLKRKIDGTLFSRSAYKAAMVVWQMPHLFNDLTQAWAFYVGCNMGFTNKIGSWGFDKYGMRRKGFENKKIKFDKVFAERIEWATIECNDALHVIKLYDTPETFHYVDPPYINTDQGHYSGYTETDFQKLLEVLAHCNGSFLLSSYPSDILTKYTTKYGWYTKTFAKTISAVKGGNGIKKPKKVEVLTANYPI